MTQQELQYPSVPGFKKRDTSRKAAEDMAPRKKSIQDKILIYFYKYGPGTADEIAESIGVERHNVRSRCSELAIAEREKRTGRLIREALIEPTGETRINSHSGKAAIVWRVK